MSLILAAAIAGQVPAETAESFAPTADRIEEIERLSRLLAERTDLFATEETTHLAVTMVRVAARYDLDPWMLLAMIEVESSYRRRGKSSVGALGLMQLMPATAAEFAKPAGVPWRGTRTLLDPETNIEIGAAYFSHLLESFEGRSDLALAAYCHGPSAVRRGLRGGALPQHQRGYGKKVEEVLRHLKAGARDPLAAG